MTDFGKILLEDRTITITLFFTCVSIHILKSHWSSEHFHPIIIIIIAVIFCFFCKVLYNSIGWLIQLLGDMHGTVGLDINHLIILLAVNIDRECPFPNSIAKGWGSQTVVSKRRSPAILTVLPIHGQF